MHVTISAFSGTNAILQTSDKQHIIYPISLLPPDLAIGDNCYIHVEVPQDLESKKARNMRKMLESLIN